MIWTEERLRELAAVNSKLKIPRYFAIKKLVETIVDEECVDAVDDALKIASSINELGDDIYAK